MKLFFIRLLVGFRNFIEYLKVVYFYYPNRKFAKVDFHLLRRYLLKNPFQIAKKVFEEKGEKDVYTYGETPLTTLDAIARQCSLKESDLVYELGCGRGRSCFWLRYFVKCQVVGIEYVPYFVKMAQATQRLYEVDRVKFVYGDMIEQDYGKATVVYFYGTCSDAEFIEKLIEKLKVLRHGTKVVTVSYPLTDYVKEPLFELIKAFPVIFPWGVTTAYLQVRTKR